VQALTDPEPLRGLFLVTFQALHPAVSRRPRRRSLSQTPLEVLESEMLQMRATLQGKTEAAATINAQLQATNEELRFANENLRTANEEIESTKEEVQALNEEIQVVNGELKEKVESLIQANDDLQNLLNSTGIATLFLDAQLRIKRFTPQVTRVLKLRPSDVGRPFGDLATTLAYDRLEVDVQEVLQTLVPTGITIPMHNGERYHTRISPYHTSDNAIDGVVMTFINLNTCQAKAHVQGR
jgi:two-component system CheB/CheR fusion protein